MANRIAIAIGHNFAWWDRGASANWTTEADVAKAVVDAVCATKVDGFEFVKVPELMGISDRNKWVNGRASTLQGYLELHLDSAGPAAEWCTTFHVTENAWAAWEAKQFQMEYTRVTGIKGRGVKGDTTTRHGRLGAIRDNKVFSLLVELGFISNKTDLAKVRATAAQWVIAGIKAMFRS